MENLRTMHGTTGKRLRSLLLFLFLFLHQFEVSNFKFSHVGSVFLHESFFSLHLGSFSLQFGPFPLLVEPARNTPTSNTALKGSIAASIPCITWPVSAFVPLSIFTGSDRAIFFLGFLGFGDGVLAQKYELQRPLPPDAEATSCVTLLQLHQSQFAQIQGSDHQREKK